MARARRVVAGAFLAAGAGAAAAAWTRSADRRAAMRAVPTEIKPPPIELPGRITSERISGMVVKVGDALAPRIPLPNGVSHRTIPGPEGAPAVPAYLYEPPAHRSDPSPAVLYIHGGGHVIARAAFYHDAARRIAEATGALVVSVDYRLAPEHPFPADVDDCYAALRWLHGHARDLGVDPLRVAVAGDSAGGGLVAALCQLAHDRAEVPVVFQAMKYPMLDDRTALLDDPTGSVPGRAEFMWTAASNTYAWSAYLGHPPGVDETRPYAVPARREELAGLPPAWIGVGDLDLFHDEATAYASRLNSAGVACELLVVPGMYHAAEVVHPKAPSMVGFENSMLNALRVAFAEHVDRA